MRFLNNVPPTTITGKTCLLRINLDIAEPREDSFRIITALPTIQFILEHGGKPLIISHRGRPQGADPTLSLKPCAEILNKIYRGWTPIDWMENVRFDPREEKNDRSFAQELAARADIYINDDFATSHRTAASLVAITKLLPSYAGLRMEEEIKNLSRARENPEHPLVVILGGIKTEHKLRAAKKILPHADYVLYGSAYHTTHPIPQDISIETIRHYQTIISHAKTVIWNGPVGNVECPPYDAGTRAIAEAITQSNAYSIVGGGDTIDFLTAHGMLDRFSCVSTGGGAMLAYLSGEKLPALEALEQSL